MANGARRGIPPLVIVLGLGLAAAILYAGVKALPAIMARLEFQDSVNLRARSAAYGRTSEQIREAIARDAQMYGIPLNPEDIDVEPTSSDARVSADYTAKVDLGFFQPTVRFHVRHTPRPVDKGLIPMNVQFGLLAIGVLSGVFWFFKGFVIFWKFRVVADVPVTPIRGMAMGPVQIEGTAVGEKTLLSPVTRVPCFFYKVEIERWTSDGRGSGSWVHYLTDRAWVPFYLQDQTGRVRVDPRGAECDLERSGQSVVGARPTFALGHAWESEPTPAAGPGIPPSESELRSYVGRVAEGMRTELFQGADLSEGAPAAASERTRPSFLQRMAVIVRPTLGMIQPGGSWGSLRTALGGGPPEGGYRLTEYCLFPDQPYDITGTCTEDPEAQSEDDRHVVGKGSHLSTFLISRQSEKALEAGLHARALRHILGGGLLAVACLAALLQNLGYL